MGSPAPSIKVEDWLRGEPLANFEPGKVYIIEFWATWCELCAAEMLDLMRLTEKYRDSGLEVVAVAANEDAPWAVDARTKLNAWLTEKVLASELSDRVRSYRSNEQALDETQLSRRDTDFVRGRPRWRHCLYWSSEPAR
ncbi:TlpA disulfide reductase family protein [Mesorhizobium sp. M0029]|uniref:TlpA disulfide reductase family protein n=1 Tax=Mesorhizobium sp. M0029 TaxID=2956850 RepID=UPI00333C9BDF